MTAKEYIKNKYTYGGANEHSEFNYSEVCNLMEEYGKQCYIQGSNDYHKVIIDSLPSEKEINIESVNWSEFRWTEIDHLDTEALLNEGFLKGVEYVITKIKGE